VLAFIARHVIDGTVVGARQGYRTVRSELGLVMESLFGPIRELLAAKWHRHPEDPFLAGAL
jgi:hypothetical protein